jgi:predicted nucleic acid-binding protein
MSEFLFPDNTVLCNFAAVERLDLLKSVLNGRGRWVEAVAREAQRSAAKLPALRVLSLEGWLDEPIEVTDPSDIRNIERLRRLFGGTNAEPRKHLGEAQSIYVILNWRQFRAAWWLSDDRESVRYARRQGITTRETIDLMNIAVVNGDISPRDGFDLMNLMADHDRYLRLPSSPNDLRRLAIVGG